MSVIVEFSLDTGDFLFGSVLATVEEMSIDLEAIVPTGNLILPYFWATGKDFEAFERHVLDDPDVGSITQLDRVGDTALYRVEWASDLDGVIDLLAETNAVILEGTSNDRTWFFRVRFPSHDQVADFYNYCTEQSIKLHVESVYTLQEASRAGREFELSHPQREALILAIEKGYFSVPRRTNLSEIAADLGISQQAVSKNVRRGAEKVLRACMLEHVGTTRRPEEENTDSSEDK